jgi:hypothetical protein
MKTHAGKASEETKEQSAAASEMADAVRKNCEQALRTGLKFQEEAGRWWSSVLNPTNCAAQWQEQFNAMTRTANYLVPLAQKPVSEMIDLAEKNSRTSADLTKKVVQAAQTPAVGESQAKWTEVWITSLEAMRANTEAVSQIGSEAIDSWAAFLRDSAECAGARGAQAA